MIYLNMLAIALICVIVIDISGVVDTLTASFRRLLTQGKFTSPMPLKPFTCSFCMAHWVNLVYICVLGEFTVLNYLYILVLSLFTTVFKDALEKIITKIQQWIN